MYNSLSGKGAIRKQFLRAERFHRGRFLFRKQLEEVAFSSKDAFGDTNEGSSREDGIDTEDGEYSLNTEGNGWEDGFDTEGNGREGSFNTEGSSREGGFDTEGDGREGGFDTEGGGGIIYFTRDRWKMNCILCSDANFMKLYLYCNSSRTN